MSGIESVQRDFTKSCDQFIAKIMDKIINATMDAVEECNGIQLDRDIVRNRIQLGVVKPKAKRTKKVDVNIEVNKGHCLWIIKRRTGESSQCENSIDIYKPGGGGGFCVKHAKYKSVQKLLEGAPAKVSEDQFEQLFSDPSTSE